MHGDFETVSLWRPVLDGDEAQRALRIVQEIADDVAAAPGGEKRGDCFLPLLDVYLAKTLDSDRHASRAIDAAATLFDTLRDRGSPALYGGSAGVGWAIHHTCCLLSDWIEFDEDDVCYALDSIIERGVSGHRRQGEYDLISGLVGVALYAVDRLPYTAGILDRAVTRLARDSERTPEGITWRTPPELLPAYQRELAPTGYYNLGVAHGLPGIAVLLAHAAAAGVQENTALTMLDGLMSWILAQQCQFGHGARFPAWVPVMATGEDHSSREAWCYGGLGLSVALLRAARLVGDRDREARAITLAELEAARPPRHSQVFDMCLCHGGAGNGHLYNRLYQATGKRAFRDAATRWFRVTLESYRTGSGGFGGYLFLGPKDRSSPGELAVVRDAGFLSGSVGVGLALLAAASDQPPLWDRLLLADVPPVKCDLPPNGVQ